MAVDRRTATRNSVMAPAVPRSFDEPAPEHGLVMCLPGRPRRRYVPVLTPGRHRCIRDEHERGPTASARSSRPPSSVTSPRSAAPHPRSLRRLQRHRTHRNGMIHRLSRRSNRHLIHAIPNGRSRADRPPRTRIRWPRRRLLSGSRWSGWVAWSAIPRALRARRAGPPGRGHFRRVDPPWRP